MSASRIVASDRVDRDGQPEPDPGDGGVDPDETPAQIGQRATGAPRVERGVGLDDVLDQPVRPAVAGGQRATERADDAGRHGPGKAKRIADGDDELTDTQPRRVTEWRRAPGCRRSS